MLWPNGVDSIALTMQASTDIVPMKVFDGPLVVTDVLLPGLQVVTFAAAPGAKRPLWLVHGEHSGMRLVVPAGSAVYVAVENTAGTIAGFRPY